MQVFSSSSLDYFADGYDRQTDVENLGGLLCDSQKLLVRLVASYPLLSHVCKLAAITYIGWAKLTSAGGGGFAIILPRSDVKGDIEQALKEALAIERFEKYKIVLGAAGVGVLFPTLFRNGSNRENEGVNFDAFENALDARSIEDLVGIWGQADREEWLFWSRS